MIMKLNPSKCQVMISCFHRTQMDVPVFHIGDSVIKQANCIKLLGILVQEDLKWNAQVGKYVYQIQHETLLSSHAQLFYSPSGWPCYHFLYSMSGPLWNMAPFVWFCGLTKSQSECLEGLQRKAFCIILSTDTVNSKPYSEICQTFQIPPVIARLEKLSLNFGNTLLNSNIHSGWLPPRRNNNLRNSNQLSAIRCRTNRYKT